MKTYIRVYIVLHICSYEFHIHANMLAAYGILYVIIICILFLNVTDKIVTPG